MLLTIHGGAGSRRPSRRHLDVIRQALTAGYERLKNGHGALSAVVEAISILEDSAVFNAGSGGVLQIDGIRRLDASVMEGKTLEAGSVIGIEGIRNPIMAARLVLDLPHVMMTNVGAERIARAHHLAGLGSPSLEELAALNKIKKSNIEEMNLYRKYFSTVGAVARDSEGNLAAGTSTGGVRAMLPGRVGDSPIIGAGTYADNSLGAVSCTGTGEQIIRIAMAKEICMNMSRMSPGRAAAATLKRVVSMGGNAGAICLPVEGGPVIVHTTNYMAAGYIAKRSIVVKNSFRKVHNLAS